MANHYICTDVYTVRAGDTLYSIAQRYQVEVDLLMRANRVRNPYNLRIGTKLCIPGPAEEDPIPQPLPEVGPEETPEPQPDASPNPGCKTTHTVKSGDTLYMIAKMHHISLDALMRANPDIDPYNLRIGTNLCIPE